MNKDQKKMIEKIATIRVGGEKYDLVEVDGVADIFWGYKYSEGSEHHNNALVSLKYQNGKDGKERYVIIFTGASYRNPNLCIVALTDKPDQWFSTYEANGYVDKNIFELPEDADSDMKDEFIAIIEDNFVSWYNYDDMYDFITEFKRLGGNYIDLNISKEIADLTEEDIDKITKAYETIIAYKERQKEG